MRNEKRTRKEARQRGQEGAGEVRRSRACPAHVPPFEEKGGAGRALHGRVPYGALHPLFLASFLVLFSFRIASSP